MCSDSSVPIPACHWIFPAVDLNLHFLQLTSSPKILHFTFFLLVNLYHPTPLAITPYSSFPSPGYLCIDCATSLLTAAEAHQLWIVRPFSDFGTSTHTDLALLPISVIPPAPCAKRLLGSHFAKSILPIPMTLARRPRRFGFGSSTMGERSPKS